MLSTDVFEKQIKDLINNKNNLSKDELLMAGQSLALLKGILEIKLEQADLEFKEIYNLLQNYEETEGENNGK